MPTLLLLYFQFFSSPDDLLPVLENKQLYLITKACYYIMLSKQAKIATS